MQNESRTRPPALWGCVCIPQLAAQDAVRLAEELTGRAVAMMDGVRPAECVWARNAKAADLGVAAGMTRIEVETFGSVAIVPRSGEQEASARSLLLRTLGLFSPAIEERADTADWECIADLSGTGRLLGEPEAVGRRVALELEQLGFTGRVVLAGNADAGLSLARQSAGKRIDVQVVLPGEEAVALHRLPLRVLGLEHEQAERFAAWGLRTLGELAALPETGLIVRMGQAGRVLRRRARGEFEALHEPAVERFVLEEQMEFDEPVETLEPLLFCLNPMLERLLLRAASRALALAAVTVSLWVERCADRVLGDEAESEPGVLPVVQAVAEVEPLPPQAKAAKAVRDGGLPARIERYGRLPKPALVAPHSHATGLLTAQIESRMGMASADAAVRKAWHRGMLVGRGGAVKSVCGVAKVRMELEEDRAATTVTATANHAARDDNKGSNAGDEQSPWGQPFVRMVRPAVATLNQALLLKMIQLDLEAHSPEGAVVRLRLTAEPGDASRVQLGLFAPPMPEPTRFEDTHARLQAVVGEGNVGRVRAADTHAAESFRLERFVLPEAASNAPPVRAVSSRPATALRRFRPPVEVRVWWHESRLECFWFEARRFRVQRCYGPWRASGDWWSTEVWSADSWDLAAESDDGELLLCLLAHDLLRDRWMLEGLYD